MLCYVFISHLLFVVLNPLLKAAFQRHKEYITHSFFKSTRVSVLEQLRNMETDPVCAVCSRSTVTSYINVNE